MPKNTETLFLRNVQIRSDTTWVGLGNSTKANILGLDSCNRTLSLDEIIAAENPPTRLIEGILYPLLLCFCTVGNVLNLLVLMRNHPKTTADIYMIALAVSDMVVMWLRIPLWIILICPHLPKMDLAFARNSAIYSGLYIWLSTAFFTLSNGIVITFSTERILLMSKAFPGTVRRLKPKTAVIILIALFVFGLMLATSSGVDYFVRLAAGRDSISWEKMRPHWLARWHGFQANVLIAVILIGFSLNPVANLVLAYMLLKRRSSRSQELGENFSANQRLGNATRIALACACLFTICQTPAIVFIALIMADQAPFCSFHFKASQRFLFGQFVWLFASVYYSINFYMYCAISQKFRKQLQARFPLMTSKVQDWMTHCKILISQKNGPSRNALTEINSHRSSAGLTIETENIVLKDYI